MMRAGCVTFLLFAVNALGPYNVLAYPVDPFTAFVPWRPSELVDVFRVTVFIDDGVGNLHVYITDLFEGKDKMAPRHSVFITKLQPWKYYVVNIAGCLKEHCTDAGNTTFSTPPESVPAPIFTRVEATGTTSFHVAWQFPPQDLRLLDGFRVVYGPYDEPSRFVVHTTEINLTVNSLTPETTFEIEVAAQYKGTDGRPVLGQRARASVATWTILPDIDIEYEADVPDGIGTTLVSWKCINCNVDYIQFRIEKYDEWRTCNGSAECDLTFMYVPQETVASGFVRVRRSRVKVQLKPPLVKFAHSQPTPGSIRACNCHGCGEETFITRHRVRKVSGSSSLSEVSVTRQNNTAVIRWNPPDQSGYEGMEVTRNCNGNKTANRLSDFHIDSSYDKTQELLIEAVFEQFYPLIEELVRCELGGGRRYIYEYAEQVCLPTLSIASSTYPPLKIGIK